MPGEQCQSIENIELKFRQAAANNDVDELFQLSTFIRTVNCIGVSSKKTSLHFAAERGQLNAIKVLINLGIDTEIKDAQGKRAVDLAKNDETKNLLELIAQLKLVATDTLTKAPNLTQMTQEMALKMSVKNILLGQEAMTLSGQYKSEYFGELKKLIDDNAQVDSKTGAITKLQLDGCEKLSVRLFHKLWSTKAEIQKCMEKQVNIHSVLGNGDITYMKLCYFHLPQEKIELIFEDISAAPSRSSAVTVISEGLTRTSYSINPFILIRKDDNAAPDDASTWGASAIAINPETGNVFFPKYYGCVSDPAGETLKKKAKMAQLCQNTFAFSANISLPYLEEFLRNTHKKLNSDIKSLLEHALQISPEESNTAENAQVSTTGSSSMQMQFS